MPEQVTILSRRTIQSMVAPGIVRPQVSVTYAAQNMMPRTVIVDPANDTPEGLRQAIAEDLRRARESRPEILELP